MATSEKSIEIFDSECLTPAVPNQNRTGEIKFWLAAFKNREPILAGLSMHEMLRDPAKYDDSVLAMKAAINAERLLRNWQQRNAKSNQFQLTPEGISLFFGLRETIMLFTPRYLRELKIESDFDAMIAFLDLNRTFKDDPRVLALLERYAFDEQAMQYILEAARYNLNKE